jgi:hypothetical protein
VRLNLIKKSVGWPNLFDSAIVSRVPNHGIVDLMVVVPAHANGFIMQAGAENVTWRSPGIGFRIFNMSIAKYDVRSATMIFACEAI